MPQCQGRQESSGVVVFLYLLGMTLMFAHLKGPHIRQHPTFVLPRLLVMVAVAVLVWRRGGLPSCMKLSPNVIFEAGVIITASSLALAYVWHVVEEIIYVLLSLILNVVEALTGIPVTCEDCNTASRLQFLAVTAVATTTLLWALNFAMTSPLTQRVVDNCMNQSLGVRFWSRVKIVFINPKNHTLEHPLEVDLSEPGGGDRNPVVKAAIFPKHLD